MYVVTFYSFKGGVGRTLALLNVAYEITNSGQRVLVVDFDLEAPAIRPDRWKQGANDDETDQVGRGPTDPGVVEFVTRYLETMRVPPVSDYIVDATPEGCRGHLAVMSAGAVDGTYGQRLNAIDWGLLYAARDGYVMFEDVRAQWQAADFDYVLLDSRTGVHRRRRNLHPAPAGRRGLALPPRRPEPWRHGADGRGHSRRSPDSQAGRRH